MAVSIEDLAQWLRTNSNLPTGISASEPSEDEAAIYQRCLDAAVAEIETAYTIPATPPTGLFEHAQLTLAAWKVICQRMPEGTLDIDDFGPIRTSMHAALREIAPYKSWRLGLGSE